MSAASSRRVFETRACAALYNLLVARADPRPYLLPANVCPIVPITLLAARQRFRLVDVERPALTLDRSACLRETAASRGSLAGVLFVRPYGAPLEPRAFFRELRRLDPGLLLIDDRCLGRPDLDGRSVVEEADVSLFSSGPSKVAAVGFGGFAYLRPGVPYLRHLRPFEPGALARVTEAYKRALREGRAPGVERDDWLDLAPPGVAWDDYRSGVLAALDAADASRARLNAMYARALPSDVCLPADYQGWRFQILVPEADALVAELRAAGVWASRHYASLGRGVFAAGEQPRAEALAAEVVNLFNAPPCDEAMASRAVDLVGRHLARLRPRACEH